MKAIYLRPKLRTVRRRRSWPARVLFVVWIVGLIVAYVFLVCRGRDMLRPAAAVMLPAEPMPLAMAPLPLPTVYLICAAKAVVVLLCLGMAWWHCSRRRSKAWHEACAEDVEAELRWSEVTPQPVPPVPADDMARILAACVAQARGVRDHVMRAKEGLGVEDYEAALLAAHDEQCLLIGCLEGLQNRVSGEVAA